MRTFLRLVNEGIVIGGQIEVTVVDVQDDHVRVRITRPGEPPFEVDLAAIREESTLELQAH